MSSPDSSPPADPPSILIVGAGISGLVLAQALRQRGVPFTLFERDASPAARGADVGWGLTIHWALPLLRELVPEPVQTMFADCLVNRAATERGEKGSFTFFDLSTGEAKARSPAKERIRVSRERFKGALIEGLDVKWSRRLSSFETSSASVTAHFDDGTSAKGSVLVGCDGAHSRVRSLCYPQSDYKAQQLPVRLLGTTVQYTAKQLGEILPLDPYFFQGNDPRSDVFLFFSYLDAPSTIEAQSDEDVYTCQIIISWPFRSGFLGHPEPTEVPTATIERMAFMRQLTDMWAEPFRALVHNLPADAEPKTIPVEDWVPTAERCSAAQGSGLVTLIGDAAHPMTMFRGEAANHAIMDVKTFVENVAPCFSSGAQEGSSLDYLRAAVARFEDERDVRCRSAVLASRQACLDAHEHQRINDESPLILRKPAVST